MTDDILVPHNPMNANGARNGQSDELRPPRPPLTRIGGAGADNAGPAQATWRRRYGPGVATFMLWLLALASTTGGLLLYRLVVEDGISYGLPAAPIEDRAVAQLGVNTRLELETPEGVTRSLQLARAAGIRWIRQEFLWTDLERRKGQYRHEVTGRTTWDKYDHIVDTAVSQGIAIIARLDRPPEWARPPGSSSTHPPLNYLDYGDFVYDFVTRYRGRITHIQIWNEPNLNHEWGDRPVDPAAYVELLRTAYRRAKEADPTIRVLAAGLAPTLERGDRGLDDLAFLERMYEHGAKGFFDIASVMAYGLWTDADDHRIAPERTNFPRLILTRRLMEAWGDSSKPIWVSEFGWNALPTTCRKLTIMPGVVSFRRCRPDWQGHPSPWGSFSVAEQRRSTIRALARARDEWPFVGVMALWVLRIPGAHPDDPTAFFALLDDNWQPRPLYASLQAATTVAALGPGWHEEAHEDILIEGAGQYTFDSTASGQRHWESPIAGTTLRLTFRGTDVVLLAPVGPGRGIAEVTIDGVPTLANWLPAGPASRALLDQYRPEARSQQRIPIATGLPDRLHELELVVTGRQHFASLGPAIGVDAILIGRTRPPGPYLITGGVWGTALIALLWRARRRLRRSLAPLLAPLLGHPAAADGDATWHGLYAPTDEQPPHGLLRWWQSTDRGPLIITLAAVTAMLLLPGWPALAFAGSLGLLVLWRPRTGVYLLILLLPWHAYAVQLGLGRVTLTELLWITTVAAVVARAAWYERWPRWPGPFGGPAALLIAAAAVATIGAQVPTLALRELRVVVLEPALLLVLIVTLFQRRGDPARLAWTLVAVGVGAGAAALALGAAGLRLIEAEGVVRLAGLSSSPNHLALFLGRLLPLAIALVLIHIGSRQADTSGQRHRNGRLLPSWRLGVALLSTGIIGAALLFSFSRGAWLASAAGVGVVLIGLLAIRGGAAPGAWRRYVARRLRSAAGRRALFTAVAVLVIVLILSIGLATRVERLSSIGDPLGGTMALRLQLWQAALRMGLDHPLFGVGPDGFLYAYPAYREGVAWREPFVSHPHNLILDYWLRGGIMGVAALGWLLATWGRGVWLLMRQDGAAVPNAPPSGVRHSQLLALGLAGSFTDFVVHGLVDNSYFLPDLAYVCWASAGLLVVLMQHTLGSPPTTQATAPPPAAPEKSA